jgi:hypothetical protein
MTYLHQNPPPPNKIKIFLGKILFSPPSSSCPAGAPRNFFHCARLRPVDMNTTKKDIRSWTADGQPNIFSLLSLFPISFFLWAAGPLVGHMCAHVFRYTLSTI